MTIPKDPALTTTDQPTCTRCGDPIFHPLSLAAGICGNCEWLASPTRCRNRAVCHSPATKPHGYCTKHALNY